MIGAVGNFGLVQITNEVWGFEASEASFSDMNPVVAEDL